MKSLTILGATGSIGRQTIDVVQQHRDRFSIEALTSYRRVDDLIQLAKDLKPTLAVIGDEQHYSTLKNALSGTKTEVAAGQKAIEDAAARPADIVMSAIVGMAGLAPTLAAIRQGRTVLLANKEPLVCAGHLMMQAVKDSGTTLIPVDSEHNALFQILRGYAVNDVKKLVLTASGGTFRTWSLARLQNVTPAQAIKHPNWSMGKKISVDSATLVNKGLELIEAHLLFEVPGQDIDILIHPQSIVHAMVYYKDGTVIAHMGAPDMRVPISYALGWPETRLSSAVEAPDFVAIGALNFEEPDTKHFPSLSLARQALKEGGNRPLIFNTANEVAVDAFLKGKIGFLDIAETLKKMLNKIPFQALSSLQEVEEMDRVVRETAGKYI